MAIELGYRCIAAFQTHPYDHMGFNHKTWDHIPYVFPKIVVSVFFGYSNCGENWVKYKIVQVSVNDSQ